MVFKTFVLGLRRLVRKLFSCRWFSVTSVIVQEIPGSLDFFRRNSNFKIAVVIDICHRAPVFLRPTFISCNTYCYVFSNGRILQEKLVAGHAFHSVTKVAALGILHVHPLLEPRAVYAEGVLYLREYIYCFVTVDGLNCIFR